MYMDNIHSLSYKGNEEMLISRKSVFFNLYIAYWKALPGQRTYVYNIIIKVGIIVDYISQDELQGILYRICQNISK